MKKTIHYRNFTITESNSTLQELLETLLESEKYSVVDNRIEKINATSEEIRFINAFSNEGNMLFCQLVYIESGKQQTILDMEEGAKSYSLLPFNLNSENKEHNKRKKEFVNSILYILVFNNHVVILKSKALTERDLENHIYWLLTEKSQLVPTKSTLSLAIQPPRAVRELTSKEPVKKISLGTPLVGTYLPSDKNISNVQQKENATEVIKDTVINTKSLKFTPQIGVSLLKQLVPSDILKNHKIEDCLDESNLRINLEITYDRKTTVKGQAFIDEIAHSVRNLHDDDIKIVLKNGGILRGDQVKLSGEITVNMNEKGIIDETDLRKQMKDWLIKKIDEEEIELDPQTDSL